MKLESWFASDIGLVRKNNQDTVGCFPELQLFILADGMGGRENGEVASRMAVETIREIAAPSQPGATPPTGNQTSARASGSWRSLFGGHPASDRQSTDESDRLRAAVQVANQRIFEASRSQPQAATRSMGTTVVVLKCALERRCADWVHVGDSRLYRLRAQELKLLTADHTLLGEAFWNQPDVPLDLPHSNRLVRALGTEPEVEVSSGSATLEIGDLFLLCSDGVSAMVKPDEIQSELAAGTTLDAAGAALIQRALDAGGRDNTSAVLVRVMES